MVWDWKLALEFTIVFIKMSSHFNQQERNLNKKFHKGGSKYLEGVFKKEIGIHP